MLRANIAQNRKTAPSHNKRRHSFRAHFSHRNIFTQNGRPAAVLLTPAAFDRLAAQARFHAAIDEGLADAFAGRLDDDAALTQDLDDAFGPPDP